MKTLLPCPFCGGDPEMKQTGKNKLKIRCKSCQVNVQQAVRIHSLEWLEERMIENWNRREPSSPTVKESEYKCKDCGSPMNEGEFKTFGVCDPCYDIAYEKNRVKESETGEQEELKSFLKQEMNGYTEFRVVVREDGMGYVHVLGRDSKTFDFKL